MNILLGCLKFLILTVLMSNIFVIESAKAYQAFEFPHLLAKGEAEINVEPEEATLYISLTSFDKQSDEALKKINLASDKVLNVMQQYKLPLDNLEASNINKSTERKRDENYNNLEILGYAFSRRLQLKLNNLASFSEIMNDLSAIDNLSDVHSQFDVKSREAVEQAALKAASKNARLKANSVAESLGMQVDSVFAISQTSSFDVSMAEFGVMNRVALKSRSPSHSIMLVPKTISISQSVNVVFKIK